MLRFFKRRRPQHRAVVQLTREDIGELLVLRWHGFTPEQWEQLPAIVKVDYREAYYRAWGLAS